MTQVQAALSVTQAQCLRLYGCVVWFLSSHDPIPVGHSVHVAGKDDNAEKTETVTVYTQQVEDLDLAAVIVAVNGMK